MQNKIIISVAGQDCTIVGTEDQQHMDRVSKVVKDNMDEIMANSALSTLQALVLASCNIADKYLKEQESSDNLRMQIKSYIDETTALRAEIAQMKHENP